MPLNWSAARKVLCVRLDALGDVLMTTPAIRALKGSGRQIVLLTSPSGAAVAGMIPEVDRTIVYRVPWMKPPSEDAPPPALHAAIQELERERFDAAVIFTVYSQSPLPAALMCYLAGIPLRLAHCRENPYHLLTDWVSETEPERQVRHECRRQLDLVASIGAVGDDRMSLRVPASARERVRLLLDQLGVDGGRWAVIHAGASASSRRYPASQFAEVCHALVRRHGWKLLLTGSREEAALVEEVRGESGISLAGLLDLEQLCALIEMAPLLITNNTGPAHIAAALGTPVVDLYALTNPQHEPWRVPSRVLFHDVPCKYCYKSICPEGHNNCLRLVEPARVVEAALELASKRETLALEVRE